MKNNSVTVGIAQGAVAGGTQELATYALGSCVGVCLYDRKNHIAGMAHIMLPRQGDVPESKNPYKFADSGCRLLLRQMLRMGASREFVTAKIAGGARMFEISDRMEGIGERNIRAVKESLCRLGIRIVAEDTGKNFGRTITFHASSGELMIKTIQYGIKII